LTSFKVDYVLIPEIYKGKWIVVDCNNKVIGSGDNPEDAMEEADSEISTRPRNIVLTLCPNY
jgi:hypothetical protein